MTITHVAGMAYAAHVAPASNLQLGDELLDERRLATIMPPDDSQGWGLDMLTMRSVPFGAQYSTKRRPHWKEEPGRAFTPEAAPGAASREGGYGRMKSYAFAALLAVPRGRYRGVARMLLLGRGAVVKGVAVALAHRCLRRTDHNHLALLSGQHPGSPFHAQTR